MHDHPPILCSIPDAARRLGLGRTKIYELVSAGRLRIVKVGTRSLLPEQELQRFAADLLRDQDRTSAAA